MIVLEFKLKAKPTQYQAIEEAIRTGQFIRNKCLRYWMDSDPEDKVNGFSLNKFTKVLADDPRFPFAKKLNSMARQASAQRAWFSISRFFENCKKKVAGKKGFPKFKKFSRSVEYKTSGWKLSTDSKYLTITDNTGIGRLKLIGTRNLNTFDTSLIKRVRLVRRARGYYVQFCLSVDRVEILPTTGNEIGIDLGLNSFLTDSNGEKVDNPRYLRKSEKRLKRLQRRLSKKKKGSNLRKKQRNKVARQHLKVSRQRKDFVVKTAKALIQSNGHEVFYLVAYEDLKVKNMVKKRVRNSEVSSECKTHSRHRHLAKSISDAGWSEFTNWLDYFAKVHGKFVISVSPQYTSQICSDCGEIVKKSLSVRTHICACGCTLDRDENAARNILKRGNTVGRTEIQAQGQRTHCLTGESLLNKVAG